MGQRREFSGREELSRGNVRLTALCVVRYYVIWSGVCTADRYGQDYTQVVGLSPYSGVCVYGEFRSLRCRNGMGRV